MANGTLLDRELAASHNITVRATSSDGSFNTAVMTINVNDVDEFDVGAVTDSDAAANAVNENAANGTVVGVTALASDADATNNTITYTLDDNAGGRFAIDGSTGVVTVANGTLLDRELAASHNITVRATSTRRQFQHGRHDDQRQRRRRIRRRCRDRQRRGSEYRRRECDGRDGRGHYGPGLRRRCDQQRDHLHAG